MNRNPEDLSYVKMLLQKFYGADGAVPCLGYSREEDEMHRLFRALNESEGNACFEDSAGNSFASGGPEDGPFTLVASHLDFSAEEGRGDGISGVIAGMVILRRLRLDGLCLPVRAGVFRCEGSSNFGKGTIGSGLVTRGVSGAVDELTGVDGRTIREIFEEKGYSLHPAGISGIRQYLELHIDRGRTLEERGARIGVVRTIAGPRRFNLHLRGSAEHSCTTSMKFRADALCAAAEIVLAVEKIGNREECNQSMATVEIIHSRPNAPQVVPGEVRLGVGLCGTEPESLDRMEEAMFRSAAEICGRRRIAFSRERVSSAEPTDMDPGVQQGLFSAARSLGIPAVPMISATDHDAVNFAGLCRTAMVFVPRGGYGAGAPSAESICDGAAVLYEYLRENGP